MTSVVASGFDNISFAMFSSIFQRGELGEASSWPSGGQREDGFIINKRHHTRWVCLGGDAGNDHTDGQTAGPSDIFNLDVDITCENVPKTPGRSTDLRHNRHQNRSSYQTKSKNCSRGHVDYRFPLKTAFRSAGRFPASLQAVRDSLGAAIHKYCSHPALTADRSSTGPPGF